MGGGGNILAFVFETYPGLLTVLLEVDGGQGHFEVIFLKYIESLLQSFR